MTADHVDPLAIPNPVASTALARPGHPVLEFGDRTWSARELEHAVAVRAGQLGADGVTPGRTVGLLGPASADWVVSFHALGWLGAAVAPLPPSATARELGRALELASADRIVVTEGVGEAALESVGAVGRGGGPAAAAGLRSTADLPSAAPLPERFWPLDEVRLLVGTSGSTGLPKVVPLTTGQLLFSAFGSAIRLGHHPEDRWLACLPLHHIGGISILVRCAFYATTVVLHDRFDAERVARVLDAGEVSLVSLVPAMLERVLDARAERPFPPALRAILVGGDRTPPRLLERCRRISVPLAVTWGMTETASQIATREPGDFSADESAGPPLPFARVSSEDGQLVVQGPLAGGRLVTRDIGRLDERGRVRIEGRAEDVLVSGGETIALAELEAVLTEHPSIADAAVVPVADPRWGERPVAVLVARSGAERPGAETMRTWCRERLAPFKVPAAFHWAGALPRNALGKVDRGRLIEELEGGDR